MRNAGLMAVRWSGGWSYWLAVPNSWSSTHESQAPLLTTGAGELA